MKLAPTGAVQLKGLLGEALKANLAGRLSTFIVDETSPPIALFSPNAVATNEGGDWYGEHAGKWLIAATRAASRASEGNLLARVEHVAGWLIAQQDADGYLGNYPPERRFMVKQPPKPFTWDGAPSVRTWDIWTHSYLALGFLALFRATRNDHYLTAARRIGDLAWRTLRGGDIQITDLGNHFGLSATVLLDAAVELHFATGEKQYLELALLILDQAEAHPRSAFLSAALSDADPSEIATGKAYQLLWNVVGLAKLYIATGEQRLLLAVEQIWRKVRDHHLTLGGGPWGGVAHRSREVFNPALVFDPNGYVETCSTMAWLQLNGTLLSILGKAEFAEEIERTAYNDLIGAQAPDGEDWCYYSFANGQRVHTTYWRCCKSSGAMAIEEIPLLAVGLTADGAISVNLLGPAEADLEVPEVGRVRLRQEGDYPFEGMLDIVLELDEPAEFCLQVRIPGWAVGATLSINGGVGVAATAGTFAKIARRWFSGDRITLALPMKPVVHRRSKQNTQTSLAPDGSPVEQEVLRYDFAAFTRGPLVFATGLVDGYRTGETLREAPRADQVREVPSGSGEGGYDLELHSPGREPLLFQPFYRVGGRQHGDWRLTWMGVAPAGTPS